MKKEYFRIKNNISNDIFNSEIVNKIENILIELKTKINLIEKYELGEFNDLSNNFILLSLFKINEIVSTAQIEGSNITTAEVENELLFNKYKKFNKLKDSLIEIKNSFELFEKINFILEKYSLSSRTFKEIHKILFKNLSQSSLSANLGKFKTISNTIKNSITNEIIFIPATIDILHQELNHFEKFINKKNLSFKEIIINSGIMHAWFERIHPFLDGNGRIGRFLIPFYFIEQNILKDPFIMISYEIKKSKGKYYDALNSINFTENYDEWLRYYFDILYISIKKMNNFLDEINFWIDEIKSTLNESKELFIKKHSEYIARILLKNRYLNINILENEFKKLLDRKILEKFPSPKKMNDFINELKNVLNLELVKNKPITLRIKNKPKMII
ncbi:Fic family protein [Candidatus Hepatoplasma crinochetorum]|uniref:Fic family protein n=1 Tax=Candidatus Hepatoplasma crinochetorum TaxID=295596 RepID=UPI003092AFB8|nr:MAG: hypothetical protein HCTKY_2620 [Candidatus Hepatoplasma crinochetorum]